MPTMLEVIRHKDDAMRIFRYRQLRCIGKTGNRYWLGICWTDEDSMAGRKIFVSRRGSDSFGELL